jgi:hypothetical protein
MTFNTMAALITSIFPDAQLYEEGGQFTITTGVDVCVPDPSMSEQDLSDFMVRMAALVCGGSIDADNDRQAVIYTGVILPL